jgi:hypothetical protein
MEKIFANVNIKLIDVKEGGLNRQGEKQ